MRFPVPGFPRLPIGGVKLLLLAGGAYFAWEHEQGKHEGPNLLCPICWLNKIAPTPEASSGSGS
jgi:hypothetical protein